MEHKAEYITIPKKRNEFGWFVVTGWVNGDLVTVRFDTKPTKLQAYNGLVKKVEREEAQSRYDIWRLAYGK